MLFTCYDPNLHVHVNLSIFPVQIHSNFPSNGFHIKAYSKSFKSLPALCPYNIYLLTQPANPGHPFHVKTNWQPPPQPSVALESHLERTKFEIASITFSNEKDNLSAQQRKALKTLPLPEAEINNFIDIFSTYSTPQ